MIGRLQLVIGKSDTGHPRTVTLDEAQKMPVTIDNPEVIAEVTKAHQRYERALESNDLDELDMLFWNDPRTLRYGPNGVLVGHAAISAYRRSRTRKPPWRTARHLHVTSFGMDFAVTNQETAK